MLLVRENAADFAKNVSAFDQDDIDDIEKAFKGFIPEAIRFNNLFPGGDVQEFEIKPVGAGVSVEFADALTQSIRGMLQDVDDNVRIFADLQQILRERSRIKT
jgi:hypothetical protein